MSVNTYTFEDLQRLDEYCRVEAEKLGLPLPEVLFHLVQSEEMYDIAARGLPGRYSHYQFGRAYEAQKRAYDKGEGRIYELVLNTRPVHAYLLDGNGIIAQLLVMAHVQGHASCFEHSRYFAPADKNILARTRAAAERIDYYIGEYGRTRVEDFIDACEGLEYQRSYDQLATPPVLKAPEWEDKSFDILFPDETVERRAEYKAEREAYKTRFPRQPERDILAFLERHARRLEDWQRDVISIIRSEMDYFVPQMRTQCLNEAQAVYYHQTIVQKLLAEDDRFTTDDFMEFESMNARVLHPYIQGVTLLNDEYEEEPHVLCAGLNPYLTGTVIYKEIKRICEDPTDEDREQWPHWAGQITWDEKRAELIETYDDAALLSEFLSPRVCEKAKLFTRPRSLKAYEDLRILEDEFNETRDLIIENKVTFGTPVIEILDADWKNRGELYMEHRDTGIGLDHEYALGTMPYVWQLWGHPAVVKSVVKAEDADGTTKTLPVWYRIAMNGAIDVTDSEPS